jgi:hypothetical protein
MRTQRNALLAGVAALALLAATGLASAQESQEHNTTAPKQPQAAQPMNKGSAAGKMDQSAQEKNGATKAQQPNRSAEDASSTRANKATAGEDRAAQTERSKQGATAQAEKTKAGKTAEARTHKSHKTTAMHERNRRTAEQRNRGHQNAAAEQRERNGGATEQQRNRGENTAAQDRGRNDMRGLQGNASGMNVQLSDEQRTQIRNTVIDARGAPRIGQVNFDVTVGTVIPRGSIQVVPVPETLVRIEPEWRGFLYFVYQNEVVIVSPRDMRIVAVVMV